MNKNLVYKEKLLLWKKDLKIKSNKRNLLN